MKEPGIQPVSIDEYHVFLASPGDMESERRVVREFFESFSHMARRWNARFAVVDYESYASYGIGRPQDLITAQTLERFKDSLALVIGVMGQRYGAPARDGKSGTAEEYDWAIESHRQRGFPEIKWFFKAIEHFSSPANSDDIREALDQWERVQGFRESLETGEPAIWCGKFADTADFREVLRKDLELWLVDENRPWVTDGGIATQQDPVLDDPIPVEFYDSVFREFRWLDIAGIDNDRAIRIPLSEMYVRLRVIFGDDEEGESGEEGNSIDIQTALSRYERLVIVGDPGSGKSTFLHYIALMIARAHLENDLTIAADRLQLEPPLPLPIFLSFWDLSDFIRRRGGKVDSRLLLEFMCERLEAQDFPVAVERIESLLSTHPCILLFDGLDEVPTEQGRGIINRLVQDFANRYPKNRYVVTSRVRAYTGEAIFGSEFTRCDIQEFDAEDRRQFLKNWFALLLGQPVDEIQMEDSEGQAQLDRLTSAIETKERIRELAVNPLLLTVIAIVHWNRKRLPEERVELYDECVDVLLGQRKSAEQTRIARDSSVLEPSQEKKKRFDRKWIRKRFAKIAFTILSHDEEELTKDRVLKILVPHFLNRGADSEEAAELEAEEFLDDQELRSGLLVSRRRRSYRFVHLTFQEYLAAWHLAKLEPGEIEKTIVSNLRNPRWFESLQLLGGELAANSDEALDRYMGFLLSRLGSSVKDQASVVALCANILHDVSGIAEIEPETQERYDAALEQTLLAFEPQSGVPPKTQLEILEALRYLGGKVKQHLMAATRANTYVVRERAIQMLMPHLADDDLFSLDHILEDRSFVPIRNYLMELFSRDVSRVEELLFNRANFSFKLSVALTRLPVVKNVRLLSCVVSKIRWAEVNDLWQELDFLASVAAIAPNEESTLRLLKDRADVDRHGRVPWEVKHVRGRLHSLLRDLNRRRRA